jgi:hypothetical protein
MTHPRLTAAASRGDERAIAELIQAALPAGNRSNARLQNQVLELILTAPHRLNQAQTLISVADVLRSLKLPLHAIQIEAYIRHETSPIWRESLTLDARLATHTTSNRSPAKRTIPSWIAEKPNFHTYRHLLRENFDGLKLSLVLPFMLYGLFCAKHYNVADTLEGNQGLIQFLHGVNLIFHEAGHILFMPFGRFMTILGGSLNQILIPTIISGYFFFKRQKYSGAITLFWVGENFWDVSVYASDGRDAVLPLLGGGDTDSHDWLNLLSMMGITHHAQLVGSLIYAVGTLIYVSAIGLTAYFSQRQVSDRVRE